MAGSKSWNDKLNSQTPPKTVELEKPFAGIPAGQMLYVGTPLIVAGYINGIPHGETRDIVQMRQELARQNNCDAMCPVSTAIFVRIVAEAALESMHEQGTQRGMTPFWRLVEPESKIAKRLSVGSDWIEAQRHAELAD